MKNRKDDWGWDSGLIRHRIMKSLGIRETPQNKTKNITAVLADADDELDHFPFRISDVVLVTDKFPVLGEMLSQGKKSIFWSTIAQSQNLFLFCDPYRPVDSSVILAGSWNWCGNTPPLNTEKKILSAQIQTHNRQLNITSYAWII